MGATNGTVLISQPEDYLKTFVLSMYNNLRRIVSNMMVSTNDDDDDESSRPLCKKSPTKKRTMKQAVKGKKEKKKKLRRDQEEEDNWLIDSFMQLDVDDQFVAAEGKERKTMSKRGKVTAKQAKKWIKENAEQGPTGDMIPGQALLHPDGEILCLVCSPSIVVQIFHYCLGCCHVNKSMKGHKCSYGNSCRPSTDGITDALSRLRHLDDQLLGNQSTKTNDNWSKGQVKTWIEKYIKTRKIFPGQILRPDGDTLLIVHPPDTCVQIFQMCLVCSSTRESANFVLIRGFKQHGKVYSQDYGQDHHQEEEGWAEDHQTIGRRWSSQEEDEG